MPILLASNPELILLYVKRVEPERFVALLSDGESLLADALGAVVDDLIAVDINGPRLSRVNFDAVALVILDLPMQTLLGPAGRRLADALGRLAQDELTLAFMGEAVATTGLFLEDGITAGLNLISNAVVLPDVQGVAGLQALLARMSTQGVRLLALDAPVSAVYTHADDSVAVEGAGNVLLVAFVAEGDGHHPTARIHAMTMGMRDTWPA
jgi:hypothetical protein